MAWVNYSESTPSSMSDFMKFVDSFVFNCPSSIKHTTKGEDERTGKAKRISIYQGVSARPCSFKSRGINGNLLTTILAQIRRPLVKNYTYAVLQSEDDVVDTTDGIIRKAQLADPYFDVMVYQTRPDMSNTEAVFYYIRNAFAHGSFSIVQNNSEDIYLLESKKGNVIKARMRLKQSTLMRYMELAKMGGGDIRSLQRIKKTKRQ